MKGIPYFNIPSVGCVSLSRCSSPSHALTDPLPMHPLLSLQGLIVDEAGFVLEGPNSNFAILTEDDAFVTPPFDNVLAGVTIQRLMELLPEVGD